MSHVRPSSDALSPEMVRILLPQVTVQHCLNGHELGIDGKGTPGPNIAMAVCKCLLAGNGMNALCAHCFRGNFIHSSHEIIEKAISLLVSDQQKQTALSFKYNVLRSFIYIYDRLRIISIRFSVDALQGLREQLGFLHKFRKAIITNHPNLKPSMDELHALITEAVDSGSRKKSKHFLNHLDTCKRSLGVEMQEFLAILLKECAQSKEGQE